MCIILHDTLKMEDIVLIQTYSTYLHFGQRLIIIILVVIIKMKSYMMCFMKLKMIAKTIKNDKRPRHVSLKFDACQIA